MQTEKEVERKESIWALAEEEEEVYRKSVNDGKFAFLAPCDLEISNFNQQIDNFRFVLKEKETVHEATPEYCIWVLQKAMSF